MSKSDDGKRFTSLAARKLTSLCSIYPSLVFSILVLQIHVFVSTTTALFWRYGKLRWHPHL